MAESGQNPIVVGVDGSEVCRGALDWAVREAARRDCVLEAVTVSVPTALGDRDAVTRMLTDQVADQVATAAGRFPAVRVRRVSLTGSPAPALVRAAHGAAMLVVGSRGAGPLVRALLGSVSAYCAAHAGCPVVIVPSQDHATVGADATTGTDRDEETRS